MAEKGKSNALGYLAIAGAAVGAYFLFGKDAKAKSRKSTPKRGAPKKSKPKKSKPKEEPEKGPDLPPGNNNKPDDPQDPPSSGPTNGGNRKIPRPNGNPGPFDCSAGQYDETLWESGTAEDRRQRIIDIFEAVGYNFRGKTKADGTFKRSGAVKRFQEDYNLVSRFAGNRLDGAGPIANISNLGGLEMRGAVGPCTLNALQVVYQNMSEPSLFKALAEDIRIEEGF